MSALIQHIVIEAAADTVWEVIAGRFDRIGEWAAAIPASGPAAAGPGLVDVPAPIAARVCEAGSRALSQVTETGTPSPRKLSRRHPLTAPVTASASAGTVHVQRRPPAPTVG